MEEVEEEEKGEVGGRRRRRWKKEEGEEEEEKEESKGGGGYETGSILNTHKYYSPSYKIKVARRTGLRREVAESSWTVRPVKDKAITFFRMSGITHPATQSRTAEDESCV